jgi:hypothetical protein
MDKTNHKNQDLQTAKKDKVDEFYTSLVDIDLVSLTIAPICLVYNKEFKV